MALQVPSLSRLRSLGGGLEQRESWGSKKVIVLSGSRFWVRGRDREQESQAADASVAEALTAVDRCDRCGAQAYVRVLLPNGLELLFCAHHNRQHSSALTKIAVGIHDETDRLARPAA
jgi:hypothetical protein